MTTSDPTPPRAPTAAEILRLGRTYDLPQSGLQVRIKHVGLLAELGSGATNGLSDAVIRSMIPRESSGPAAGYEAQRETITHNAEVWLAVARRALTSPRIVLDREPDYAADEIGPTDLGDEDLIFIHNVATGVADEFIPFRSVAPLH